MPAEHNYPTRDGHLWVCHDCPFTTDDIEKADAHLWEGGDYRNFSHWVHEHPLGFRGHPATREMHTSDTGGTYLNAVPIAAAAEDARRWRERVEPPPDPPTSVRTSIPAEGPPNRKGRLLMSDFSSSRQRAEAQVSLQRSAERRRLAAQRRARRRVLCVCVLAVIGALVLLAWLFLAGLQ